MGMHGINIKILNLYETGTRYRHETVTAMALYSKVYRDLQGLQSSSVSLSTLFVI
jgi:hypothetical protein